MIPLGLVVAGLIALAAGWLLMRRLGTPARIGRILAATPVVPVARAIELAHAGGPRYVAVGGRLDSSQEFLDESDRPLVFRRTRLELGRGSAWDTVEHRREVVPFEVAGGDASIAVDGDTLDAGLVVVSRESEGTAAEIPGRVPDGTDPATVVRLRVEFLSTIDHALVLGVPGVDPQRGPILRPGLGRPLVVTTLEPDEAMRLLASGRHGTTVAISGLLAAGVGAIAGGLLWAVIDAVT